MGVLVKAVARVASILEKSISRSRTDRSVRTSASTAIPAVVRVIPRRSYESFQGSRADYKKMVVRIHYKASVRVHYYAAARLHPLPYTLLRGLYRLGILCDKR